MAYRHRHLEAHRSGRGAWLRAAVLGSDDAIVSTTSLMLGVAAASATRGAILTAGVAGLVAGALSMAVGEYVSVSSQRDAERADIEREKGELASAPESEVRELAGIYMQRGVSEELAWKVAEQLSARDPLKAHLRDELGLEAGALARPLQAALISAASFAFFSLLPIACLLVASPAARRARRLPRRRTDRTGRLARNGRRRPGDGGDRAHRPAARRRHRLTHCSGEPTAHDDPSQHADHRQYKQCVNQPAQRKVEREAEHPQDREYDCDSPK